MRRRSSPYSRIEEIQRSRSEVWALVIITVVLGFLLGLFTDGLSGWLRDVLPAPVWAAVIVTSGALTLTLTLTAAWLFYGHAESRAARIELWLPYHFPTRDRVMVVGETAYQPPRHARRAFARRYARGSDALKGFLDAWAIAQAQGKQFQHFIAEDHQALAQCLALYVLHRYGEETLGAEAAFGWNQIDLPAQRVTLDALPAPLRDNAFVRADQKSAEWRMLLPEAVHFDVHDTTWVLRHRRYGQVTLRWFPAFAVAGPHSQPYEALTTWLNLTGDAHPFVVGCRFEASAHIRRALLPASEAFQAWAAGLLARLEEGLDFGYYIAQRPARIMRDLEWKIGWVPEGRSLVDMLQSIDARLEALEMATALESLDGADADEEEGADFVV